MTTKSDSTLRSSSASFSVYVLDKTPCPFCFLRHLFLGFFQSLLCLALALLGCPGWFLLLHWTRFWAHCCYAFFSSHATEKHPASAQRASVLHVQRANSLRPHLTRCSSCLHTARHILLSFELCFSRDHTDTLGTVCHGLPVPITFLLDLAPLPGQDLLFTSLYSHASLLQSCLWTEKNAPNCKSRLC